MSLIAVGSEMDIDITMNQRTADFEVTVMSLITAVDSQRQKSRVWELIHCTCRTQELSHGTMGIWNLRLWTHKV